jgi:ubiquinone biosynthesis protein
LAHGYEQSQIHRYRQIADILARHGPGYLLSVMGIDRFAPRHQDVLRLPKRDEPYTRPEHVRMALEELGATYVMLAQMLSTRPDLVPHEDQTELAKLQDQVPPVPVESIVSVLEADFGRPVEEVFATFESKPLAAASARRTPRRLPTVRRW